MRIRFFIYAVLLTVITSLTGPDLLFAKAPAKNVVNRITYKNNKVTVYVTPARKNVRPKVKYNTLSGGRFYMDVLNARVESKLNFNAKKGNVTNIKRNQFSPDKARVVLKLRSSSIKPDVEYRSNPPRYVISVGKNANGKSVVSSSKSKTTAVRNGRKFRILLDPGHGGWEPGAIGRNGTKEKHVTLDIAKKLETFLKGRGDVEVKLTRRSDKYVSLRSRRNMASSWKADIFISIHANGSSHTHLNQTEIYYNDRKSYGLAKLIRKELVNELNKRDGGVRKKAYSVIYKNRAKYASVLVESDYLTNRSAEKKLKTDAYQNRIAKSLYESIDSYLNTKQ